MAWDEGDRCLEKISALVKVRLRPTTWGMKGVNFSTSEGVEMGAKELCGEPDETARILSSIGSCCQIPGSIVEGLVTGFELWMKEGKVLSGCANKFWEGRSATANSATS